MKNNFNEKLDVFMMAISSLFAVAVIIYLFYSILSQISTINEFRVQLNNSERISN